MEKIESESHPLLGLALSAARPESGCRICGEELTHHEMLGDQVLAASVGGDKGMHRRCWEVMSKEDQRLLVKVWEARWHPPKPKIEAKTPAEGVMFPDGVMFYPTKP